MLTAALGINSQACQSALTVKHILIECTHLSAARQRYFRVDTLKQLFEIVDSRNIIAFIKDINFYRCIHRVSKKQSKLFSSELRQISINFDNFWQKDGQDDEIM